jgi:hypothetical protein
VRRRRKQIVIYVVSKDARRKPVLSAVWLKLNWRKL